MNERASATLERLQCRGDQALRVIDVVRPIALSGYMFCAWEA
jgi:hypothetical protein